MVCGTIMADAASGSVVTDGTAPGRTVHVGNLTNVGIALLATRDCGHGATLTFNPSVAADLVKTANTQDGKTAAAILAPRKASFTVTIQHGGAASTVIVVNLGKNFTGPAS